MLTKKNPGHFVRFPLRDIRCPDRIVSQAVPLFLPWDILEVLQRGNKLSECLHGPGGLAWNELFWECAFEEGWGAKHPINDVSPALRKEYHPVHVFVDEVKTYSGSGQDQCFEVYAWSGCGVSSATRSCRHYLFQLPAWRTCKESNERAAPILSWIMKVAAEGGRPKVGFLGEVLKDGGVTYEPPVKLMLGAIKTDQGAKVKMHN